MTEKEIVEKAWDKNTSYEEAQELKKRVKPMSFSLSDHTKELLTNMEEEYKRVFGSHPAISLSKIVDFCIRNTAMDFATKNMGVSLIEANLRKLLR